MDPSSSHKAKTSTSPKQNQAECNFYLYTITPFLIIITINSLASLRTNTSPIMVTQAKASDIIAPNTTNLTFHPLKDPSVPAYTHPNKTWFMSTLSGRNGHHGLPEHFVFPSHRHPRILCIHPRNKSYTLAARNSAFPHKLTIRRGLTFVADSFYDYENPWHGLNAVSPFFAWMRERGRCERPARLVLYHNGEAVRRVGRWVEGLVKAALGNEGVVVDALDDDRLVCFERAVVMRRGLGGMDGKVRNRVFGMLRCKAWKQCGVGLEKEEEKKGVVSVSLVGRERKRGFKNESMVREVMERVCSGLVYGCSFRVYHFDANISFCDQVKHPQ